MVQASFTAEESSQDRIDVDTMPLLNSVEAQRVQQLESLLVEYKTTMDGLTKELDAIGGGDPSSLGSGRSRKDLADEAEMARASKAEVEKGAHLLSYNMLSDPLNILALKHCPKQKVHQRSSLRKLTASNRHSSNFVEILEPATKYLQAFESYRLGRIRLKNGHTCGRQ